MLYETFICVTIPDIWSPLLYLNTIYDDKGFYQSGDTEDEMNQLFHMNSNG